MTDTTATFVTSLDSRIFPFGSSRRAIRLLVDGVVVGLGTIAAAGVLVTTVTLAAAWIINTALATNPDLRGQAQIALANPYPTLARARDLAGLAGISTDAADGLTFEAQWARRTAPASTRTGAMPQDPVEPRSDVASLQPNPSSPPQSGTEPEIIHAPDSTRVAELTPAATPGAERPGPLTRPPDLTPAAADTVPLPLPRPHPAQDDIARSPAGPAVPLVAAATPPAPASTSEKHVTSRQADNKSMLLPDPASRIAVYDIAAHTVYLPSGAKLEAHSGLGDKLDDPRYVSVRNRGPTPPNVYDLTLREQLFHDVRAIRLNPVGDGSMFGRDGMLAHTYMLGANGQSNGCVSFKDYPAFLHAYLKGEVARLVVVPHLGDTSWRTASARRGPAPRYADNSQ
jgi:hypothetical protein